jgi:hypothetical protein
MASISAVSFVRSHSFCSPSRAADGNDPQAAGWSDGQIDRVIGDRDAHACQRLDHVGHDGNEVIIHADFDVHDRHDRSKVFVCSVKLVLRNDLLADADCEYAGVGSTLYAGNIAAEQAKFFFFLIKLLG